jgi:hypothetical protein
MKKELLNLIGPGVVILGGLLVLFALGGSDAGTFTTGQALARVGIGCAVIAVGVFISRLIGNITNYK